MLKGNGSVFDLTGLMHRLDRLQVSADRQHVVARHLGVGRERHRGVKPAAVRPHAFAHRGVELLVGPGADAGVVVRGEVRRGDHAERRLDRPCASKGFADLRHGVTGIAIRDRREIAALFDLVERLAVRIRAAEADSAQPCRRSADRYRDSCCVTHGPAAPDFSDTGRGSRMPPRTPTPPRCRWDCSRRSAGRRWRPSRTNSARPSSAGSG